MIQNLGGYTSHTVNQVWRASKQTINDARMQTFYFSCAVCCFLGSPYVLAKWDSKQSLLLSWTVRVPELIEQSRVREKPAQLAAEDGQLQKGAVLGLRRSIWLTELLRGGMNSRMWWREEMLERQLDTPESKSCKGDTHDCNILALQWTVSTQR